MRRITGEQDVSEQMLTEEQCITNSAGCRERSTTWYGLIYEAGRASKAAEYADVPPEKWKALYLVA